MHNANNNRLALEADFFSQQNNQRLRQVAWTSLPMVQQRLKQTLDVDAICQQLLSEHQNKRGLCLAAGDMTGPWGCFKQCGIEHIDAWDISEGQREKFFANRYDGSMAVDYHIGDVNPLQLPANSYDLIIVQQAYHHFENLEGITEQIAQSLKPHGVLLLKDYIGPNQLQRSAKQLTVCQPLWDALPDRLRTNAAGHVSQQLHIPAPESLPPYEAVRAEDILPILESQLHCVHKHCYGGVLFPLCNGFAHNYEENAEDLARLEIFWQLDQHFSENGLVDPNFIRAIYARKDSPYSVT